MEVMKKSGGNPELAFWVLEGAKFLYKPETSKIHVWELISWCLKETFGVEAFTLQGTLLKVLHLN